MKLDDESFGKLCDWYGLAGTTKDGDACDRAYQWGAAVAFGLIGMAEAIRQRERERPRRELDVWYEQMVARSEANMTYAQQALDQQYQQLNAAVLQSQGLAAQQAQRGPTLDEILARAAWLHRERKK